MSRMMVWGALLAAVLVTPLVRGDADEEKKSSPKKVRIGKIEWFRDYDEAMKVAKKEKRPLWLHFGEHPG